MLTPLGLSLGLMLGPSPSPSPVPVTWTGASGCQQGPRAQAMVDALLGPQVEPSAQARVEVAAQGDAWRAAIEIIVDGVSTQRALDGRPCAALVDAAALVIAVTVDPLGAGATVSAALGEDPGPTPSPPPEIPVQPAPDPPPPVEPRPLEPSTALTPVPEPPPPSPPAEVPPRAPPRWPRGASLWVEGGGNALLLPGLGGHLGGGLALSIGRARVTVGGWHGFARAIVHPDGIDAGADVSRTAAAAHGCWAPVAGRFTFPLCGGLEAGVVAAQGFGLERTTSVRSAWVAVIPRAQATLWALPGLGIGLSAEVPVALVRPRFSIDDFVADLVRVGPAGLRLGLTLEVKFFDETRRTRATE